MVFRYFKAEMLQQYLEMATLNEFRGNVHFEKEHFLNFPMIIQVSCKTWNLESWNPGILES